MRRFLSLRFTPGYVIVFAVITMVAFLIGLPFLSLIGSGWVLLGASAALGLIPLIAVRGGTLSERRRVRRQSRETVRAATVHERDRAGIVWDGRRASVYIEVSPAGAFPLTWVSDSDDLDRTPLPVDRLAGLLHQLDIRCSEIAVLGVGYRAVLEGHAPSKIGEAVLGNVSWPSSGQTYIRVSLDIDTSMSSVLLRARAGSIPLGLDRAVLMAAARVRAQLDHEGFSAKVLPVSRVSALTEEIVSVVGAGMDSPQVSHGGKVGGLQTVSATVDGPWREFRHKRWMGRLVYRSYEHLSITPGHREAQVRYTVTYATRDRSPFSGLGALGLSVVRRQQRQVLTNLVPLAVAQPVETAAVPVSRANLNLYAGGLGMLIGASPEKGRLFMRLDPEQGTTLHIIGSDILAKQLMLRLILSLVSVDVRLGVAGGEWDHFVRHLGSSLVTFRSNWTPGIVVCDEREAEQERQLHPTRTIIVVAADIPQQRPDHSIIAQNDTLVVTVGMQQERVPWRIDQLERSYLSQVDAQRR